MWDSNISDDIIGYNENKKKIIEDNLPNILLTTLYKNKDVKHIKII